MNEDSNEVFNKMLVVEEGDEDYEDRLSLKRLSRHQSAAKRTSALNVRYDYSLYRAQCYRWLINVD